MGIEGDKYLLFCLLEILDIKEFSKEKNVPPKPKMDFFLQRLNHSIAQTGFLDYFSWVIEQISSIWHMNVFDIVNDMNKALKLNNLQQIAISLACWISPNKKTADDGNKLIKKSLQEYHSLGKVQIFPDHIQHMLLFVVRTSSEFKVF